MVYVQSRTGQPLMPTVRYGKVRRLIKAGRATVIRRCPFTIRLEYESTTHTQPVTLGVDAGSKTVGLSASTETRELYSAELMLRNDIVKLLSERKELRRSRRSRKRRYRKPRFDNRVRSKNRGWLAPSVEQRIGSHMAAIAKVCGILPVSRIIVETAQFDTQLLKAQEKGLPAPSGTDYQQGDQLGFWNVREYVLWRDDHECQCCHGKSGSKILEVHHVDGRREGGNSPDELVTLCDYCHKGHHKDTVRLPASIRRKSRPLRDAAFMSIMRWTLYERLRQVYPDVHMTYGYITKHTRITHKLEKSHRTDALCIAGHPEAERTKEFFLVRKIRCHNRKLHKLTIGRGGIRKSNQAPHKVCGFRLFDKILYAGNECFIFGRRASGYFDIRRIDGTVVHGSASTKSIRFLEPAGYYITERRMALLS